MGSGEGGRHSVTRYSSNCPTCAGQSGSLGHLSYECGKLMMSLAGASSVWVGCLEVEGVDARAARAGRFL